MTEQVLLHLSRAIAIILVAIYLCYLVFQLGTHHDLFADNSSEEGEVPALSLSGSMACLTLITLIVAACSGGGPSYSNFVAQAGRQLALC